METNQKNSNNQLLCHWNQGYEETYFTLLQSIERIYEDIVELNLDEETIFVLRNSSNPQQEGTVTSYRFEASQFCRYNIMEEDRSTAEEILDIDALKSFYESGQKSSDAELRVRARETDYEWVELCTYVIPKTNDGARKILITVRNINSSKLMKGIIDRFIYDSCDYFIYLDAQKDRYVMFSGSDNGTPLPPTVCDSYSTEIVKYARDFVAEEEQDYTIEQMELPYVLNKLDTCGEHTFYTGVMDEKRGYTRKCLRYLYYDRKNKMILLVRTDVTDIYLEEKKRNDQLLKALKEAKTDFLTGLSNRMDIESSINKLIKSSTITSGAFFFTDIDNFKQINDQFGHNRGDCALIYLGQALKKLFPDSCVIGRLGGDEFIVFYPDFDSLEQIETLAGKICSVFDSYCFEELPQITFSCSVGISCYPADGVRYEDLSKNADTALYCSKNNGRRKYTFFHETCSKN